MSSESATPDDKCPTGISGLDSVLCGGLPRNRLYVIEGDPGVGKTTLALQFLLEGARRNEKGLYITLSETRDELQSVAKSHGWSLDNFAIFELSALQAQLKSETDHTFFHPSEVELNKTTRVLMDEIERVKPARVVLDSLSEMRLMSETPLRYRRQILSLKQYFAGIRSTVLFLDDRSTSMQDLHIQSLAHGVLSLQKSTPLYGIVHRNISVTKIRGAKFREGFHDYSVTTGGIVVYPRLIAAEHPPTFVRGTFSSGISGFDELLGGGMDRGTSTLIMGPPGTGKSTLALKHALEAAKKGERSDVFTFDETIGTLLQRTDALGMDIRPHMESGLLRLHQVDPAEILPGEVAHRISDAVETGHCRMVIIDSLNGYLNAIPENRYLNMQLHELLTYLNQQGVITILVLAQRGMLGPMQSEVELTYLADTVILLRFFETRGEVRQAISVLKKRSGKHERTIREYRVDGGGIHLGAPLRDFHGVLSGIPTFSGPQDKIMEEKSPK